jgi:tetratricopeptide (TPR) repeat protein
MKNKMRKITSVIVLLITATTFAQGSTDLKAHYEAFYKQMKIQGDVQGIINAMTHLDVLSPSQKRRDTLAYFYVSEGKYVQALNTIGIEKNAGDSDLNVEVKAIALKNLNDPKRALEHYNVLFNRKPDTDLAYEIADLMMQTQDIVGAKSKIEYGLANVTDAQKRAFFETQRPYETSLKAAFYYLKALVTFQENQTTNIDAALKLTNDALAIDPNFNMAKITREALEARKVAPKN